jgi:hypothetical protein
MTTLLTVLLVADESSPQTVEKFAQTLKSWFAEHDSWNENYEILTATLTDEVLLEASGKLSGINALLVRNGYLAQCSGKYVWIIPSCITLANMLEVFASLSMRYRWEEWRRLRYVPAHVAPTSRRLR